jgi:hypothetical protein
VIEACGQEDTKGGGKACDDVVEHDAQGIVAAVGPTDGAEFGDVKEAEGEKGENKAGPKA